MTTALITHPDCLTHVTPHGHPEQVARLRSVLDALEGLSLEQVMAPMAQDEDIHLLHPQGYVNEIKTNIPKHGNVQMDDDTFVSPGSLNAAYRAVGAVLRGVDMVLADVVQNAFCATRPPGHHAEYAKTMGFCLLGTVALAAKHAMERHDLKRVAIVDFDVHHGNGTQDLLEEESRALLITSQQMPLWPGSGDPRETGRYNNVLNVALTPESDGAVMRERYIKDVFPRIADFDPELILISAGFDAHRDDPLAQLQWDEDDFAWLTQEICALAAAHCSGRVVSTLEGGYHLEALASCARTHVEELIKAGQ